MSYNNIADKHQHVDQPSDRGKVPCIVYGVPKYTFKPPPQPKIAISLSST